jgi:drug/metabolite transporter (DMT)-like permease
MSLFTKPMASTVVNAVLLGALATLFGSIMQTMVKYATSQMPVFEVVFFRTVFGVLLFAPMIARGGWKILHTNRMGLMTLRGLLHSGSMMLNFLSISLTPLATIAALRFSAPLWATLLAVIALHEVLRARRISALIAGFAGTLVVLRPGLVAIDTGTTAALASAAIWGVVMVIIKVLSRTESGISITFYGMLFIVPISGIAASFSWVSPDPLILGWILVMSVIGNIANLFMVASFKRADVAVLMPIQFTTLIWVSLFGYVWFDEGLDVWTWIGGGIIFTSTFYMTLRERKVKKAVTKTSIGASDSA